MGIAAGEEYVQWERQCRAQVPETPFADGKHRSWIGQASIARKFAQITSASFLPRHA
jgi:hypothetical protein